LEPGVVQGVGSVRLRLHAGKYILGIAAPTGTGVQALPPLILSRVLPLSPILAACCGVCVIHAAGLLMRFHSSVSAGDQLKNRRREAAMRLAACLTMCLMLILANAAQTDAQAPSDPQAYCVNHDADFYPYTGEPCKSGYQLGPGNCRKTDGRMVAVPREQCAAMAGTVEVPFESGRRPSEGPQAPKSK
jgi:hypothetical protein